MLRTIEEVILKAKEMKGSDVHLVAGLPPKCRTSGSLENMDNYIVTPKMTEAYAKMLYGDAALNIKDGGEIDMSGTFADTRIRGNIFIQQGAYSIALRLLSDTIPEIADLGLPETVKKFVEMKRGIILVTGETGSGKSTSLAAIINEINKTRKDHIITLEDPIEYVYKPKMAVINQREIGRDTSSYATGLKAILREDPDVILVGEMRDIETIEIAITAAETGHLVFATLHTNSAADSIDRMVSTFPVNAQPLARVRLSSCLQAVLSQQLIRKKKGGRVLAYELMICTNAISALIREGKTEQIPNSLLTSASAGCVTMDNCLLDLYRKGIINMNTCLEASHNTDNMKKLIIKGQE